MFNESSLCLVSLSSSHGQQLTSTLILMERIGIHSAEREREREIERERERERDRERERERERQRQRERERIDTHHTHKESCL